MPIRAPAAGSPTTRSWRRTVSPPVGSHPTSPCSSRSRRRKGWRVSPVVARTIASSACGRVFTSVSLRRSSSSRRRSGRRDITRWARLRSSMDEEARRRSSRACTASSGADGPLFSLRRSMRSRALIVVAVLSAAVVSGGWLMQAGFDGAGSGGGTRARLFDEVMAHVERFYIDSVADDELYKKAVDGMLLELHDPHSAFLTPDRLAKLN